MISLSTITTNSAGNIVIREKADYRKNVSRLTRVKTLDGGVSIVHSGVVDGDRTLFVKCQLSKADSAKLWTIYTGETYINIGIKDGFFLGTISSLEIKNGIVKITIFIKNRET